MQNIIKLAYHFLNFKQISRMYKIRWYCIFSERAINTETNYLSYAIRLLKKGKILNMKIINTLYFHDRRYKLYGVPYKLV